jgi:hypothetical protein
MNPRKYPRTMQEAFGPYTSPDLQYKHLPHHRRDRIVLWGCLGAFLGLLAVLWLWGW